MAHTLTQMKIDGAPKVLAADINTEKRVYWVAREHVEDAMLLADLLRGAEAPTEQLAEIGKRLKSDPYRAREDLAVHLGMAVADTLGQFASNRIFHGGLDLRTTLALRGDGTPVVLDIGVPLSLRPRPFYAR